MPLVPQLSITATSGSTVSYRIRIVEQPQPHTSSATTQTPAWAEGVQVLSEREPRLLLYPNFLSSAEANYMHDVARWGAAEAAAAASFTAAAAQAVSWDGGRKAKVAASGRTISIHAPRPCDDPAVQTIEERCAAVTGIPIHAGEEPLGFRQTGPSTAEEVAQRYVTALHVDTNQGGTYRCATVIMYLNDLDVPLGGETRFPLVGSAEGSAERDAAVRLARMGATAFSPDETVVDPPIGLRRTLLEAAEAEGVGVRVRPRKGAAAVFWTHTLEGLDPYSWHAGARLPPEADGGGGGGGGEGAAFGPPPLGGKLVLQKFKSLPRRWRPTSGQAVRLPPELAPPPL